MTDWNKLTEACKQGMVAAAENPGRYGGRYVGRYYDRKAKDDVFVVLDDDDPETVPEHIDVLAQCCPKKVNPIGGAGTFLKADGSVEFPDDRR